MPPTVFCFVSGFYVPYLGTAVAVVDICCFFNCFFWSFICFAFAVVFAVAFLPAFVVDCDRFVCFCFLLLFFVKSAGQEFDSVNGLETQTEKNAFPPIFDGVFPLGRI